MQQPQQQAASSSSGRKPQDSGTLTREDFDGGPVSIDEIEPGLFLGKNLAFLIRRNPCVTLASLPGNLTAATHMETLRSFKISHILTLDSVPLPQHILEASFLTTKYIQSELTIPNDIIRMVVTLVSLQLLTCRAKTSCSTSRAVWSSSVRLWSSRAMSWCTATSG